MQGIAQQIADFVGIDIVYGYLAIGIVIGLVIGRLSKRSAAAEPARIGGGLVTRSAGPSAPAQAGTRIRSASSVDLEVNGQKIDIDPETMAEVHRLSGEGNKIEAIKLLREATGLGLAEAKQLVEAFERMKR